MDLFPPGIISKETNDIDLILERDEKINEILKDTLQVKDLFDQIAILVETQQTDIDNIQHSIEKTVKDVETANKELKTASIDQKSNCILL